MAWNALQRAVILGKCQAQTANDRFGPNAKNAVRDRERATFGLLTLGGENPVTWPPQDIDQEVEQAQRTSIYHTIPAVQSHRDNLTALSQTCNLYFAAYQGRIFVYRPRANSTHFLPTHPDLQLAPRESRTGRDVGGYLDRHAPHTINHLVTGILGEREIVLVAYDNGEVIGYDVKGVLDEVLRLDQVRSLAASKGQASKPQPLALLQPFFHENVGISAWGLAIHTRSRLIAVSSNLHEVVVFALALSKPDHSPNPTLSQASCEAYGESIDTHVRQRARTWRIVIALDISARNLPNVSFLDDEKGFAEKVCAMDISGVVWLADIWKSKQAVCRMDIGRGTLHVRDRCGWGVVPLPTDSFLPVRSMQELFGGDIGHRLDTGAPGTINIKSLLRNLWDDPCASARREMENARLPGSFTHPGLAGATGPAGWSLSSPWEGNPAGVQNPVPTEDENSGPHDAVTEYMSAATTFFADNVTTFGAWPLPSATSAVSSLTPVPAAIPGPQDGFVPDPPGGLFQIDAGDANDTDNGNIASSASDVLEEEDGSQDDGGPGAGLDSEMVWGPVSYEDDTEPDEPSNENEPPSTSSNPEAPSQPPTLVVVQNNAGGEPVQTSYNVTWTLPVPSIIPSLSELNALVNNSPSAVQGIEDTLPEFITTAMETTLDALPGLSPFGYVMSFDGAFPSVFAGADPGSPPDLVSPGQSGKPKGPSTAGGQWSSGADGAALRATDLSRLFKTLKKHEGHAEQSGYRSQSPPTVAHKSSSSQCCGFPCNRTSEGPAFPPLVFLPHQGQAQRPEVFSREMIGGHRTKGHTTIEDPSFSAISKRYHFLTTYGNEIIMKATPSRSKQTKLPDICCTDLVPNEVENFSRIERRIFEATKRLNMLLQVPELSLLVIGSQTGRVVLVTPTRMAGKGREIYGEPYEYGFRVETVLPLKSDEDKYRTTKRPLHGVAVGPAMYSGGDGADGARVTGPARFRIVLHYTNHDIITYEIGRSGDQNRLCIF